MNGTSDRTYTIDAALTATASIAAAWFTRTEIHEFFAWTSTLI
jgi:hypothetical protein